ncbi:hypothetical protein [Streptomyces sp. NPDC086023]|uniref:hypothetical protein n=1 Tax=Streptomyces sp. NPDC086023 TaxID=3365746 RepID=UPI0037D5FA59
MLHHPVSIHVGAHTAARMTQPRTDPVHRLLWGRGFSYCSRLNAYVAPSELPVEQQEHLVHRAVHALTALGYPVAHFHHPQPGV